MRRTLLNLSLLSLLAAPLAARAASLDELTFTNTVNSSDVLTFIVPTSSVVSSGNTNGSSYFYLTNVQVSSPGTIFDPGAVTSSTETVLFFTNAYASGTNGGLLDNNLATQSLNITIYGEPLFSSLTPAGGGSYTATFSPASGVINGYDESGDIATFDYNIAAYTPPGAPTPEPSSLMLLGTGAIGAFGAFRRRLMA